MGEIPTRVKAAAAAHMVAVRVHRSGGGGFEIADVMDEAGFFDRDSTRRSTRRALRDLELMGYLERETPGAHVWHPSARIAELLEG